MAVFASYKIGASGGVADGFLDETGLARLVGEMGYKRAFDCRERPF